MKFYFLLALGSVVWCMAYFAVTWLFSVLVWAVRGAIEDPVTGEISFRPWGQALFAVCNVTTCTLTAGFLSSAVVQYLAADPGHWPWFWYPWGFAIGVLIFAKGHNNSWMQAVGVLAFFVAYPLLCIFKPDLWHLTTIASWVVPSP